MVPFSTVMSSNSFVTCIIWVSPEFMKTDVIDQSVCLSTSAYTRSSSGDNCLKQIHKVCFMEPTLNRYHRKNRVMYFPNIVAIVSPVYRVLWNFATFSERCGIEFPCSCSLATHL